MIAIAALLLVVDPASALASSIHGVMPAPPLADVLGIGGAVKDLVHTLGGAVVGGVNWTTDLAGQFIINTLGGLVDLLIPDSWAREGMSIMHWVVAVPNYGAKITGPTGSNGYAFAGINDLRDLFMWIGVALLPLSLTYASSRAMFGLGDHVAMPVLRTLTIGVALMSYTWLWAQVAAVCNQITKAILGVPRVEDGINTMFEFIVGGGALAGLPLIGLIVMGAAGACLLAAIFVKVLMTLTGAIVYVTGPLMIGVAPTERGAAAARAWLTVAIGLFVLPIVWTTVFAVAALLINDSTGASAVIGTSSEIGTLLGGLVVGLAAIAGFWLNLKLTRFAASILGGQMAGTLALATTGHATNAASQGRPTNARDALTSFGSRLGGSARGAAVPVAASGRAGAAIVSASGGALALARHGLLGAGVTAAKRGVGAAAASPYGQAVGGTKAGALATRIARAGTRGWLNPSEPIGSAGSPTLRGSGETPGSGGSRGRAVQPDDARRVDTRMPPGAHMSQGATSQQSPSQSAHRHDWSSEARPSGSGTQPASSPRRHEEGE